MRIQPLIYLLILTLIACKTDKDDKAGITDAKTASELKFDKKNWRAKKGEDYLYREKMVEDVLYNDTIRSLSKDQILELLGEPDRINEGHLYYTVAQTRLGFWPLKTKAMVIKLVNDEKIEWIKLYGG